MNFVPPPYADDVDEDFGPYNRDEIVVARASLLHTLQRENSMAWQGIKYKLGILPNGQRLRTFDSDHVWLPPTLPDIWSAPVVLHDPTAAPESRTDDQSAEEKDGAEVRDESEENRQRGGKEECATGSETQVITVESSSSSLSSVDGTANFTFKKLLGKRSREAIAQSDSDTLVASGDGHNDDVNRKKHKSSVKEKKNSSKNVCASKAKIPKASGCEADKESSKLEKLDNLNDEDENQQYEVVFQCDLCDFLSCEKALIQQHLKQDGHYSASRYLATMEGTGELRPVYLSAVSLVTEPQHIFKEKVAVCPLCHTVYPSLQRCLQHTSQNHKRDGLYSFRVVTESSTFDLVKDTDKCRVCGITFQNKELWSHVKETQHMTLYVGKKTSQAMMIFICPFCQIIHVNYNSYKDHVFNKHSKEIPLSEALTATCCVLGESQPAQTMLPKDPGISLIDINYDFSKSVSEGEPYFEAAWNKKKKQRENMKLRSMGLLPMNTEKNKKQTAMRMQRLAAFKAKMKASNRKKNNWKNL